MSGKSIAARRIRWAMLALAVGWTLSSAATHPTATALRVDGNALRAGDRVLRIEFAPDIPPQRAQALRGWLAETAEATLSAYGRFPLADAIVRVRQVGAERRGDSPVPWGQTLRGDSVAVLLYVRRDAGIDELRADWTAVHEFSHLFHPYLGDDGRWLAEGLASYYQNVLRARTGLLDADEAWRRLDAGFGRGRREGSAARLDELSRSQRGTMRVYWAGAVYWLEMDVALRRSGSSLDAVLSHYSDCCLHGEVAPEEFVMQLDRIAGGERFRRGFERYAASRAFPSVDGSYTALGIQETAHGLRFADRADAVRLRNAIMGRRGLPQDSLR